MIPYLLTGSKYVTKVQYKTSALKAVCLFILARVDNKLSENDKLFEECIKDLSNSIVAINQLKFLTVIVYQPLVALTIFTNKLHKTEDLLQGIFVLNNYETANKSQMSSNCCRITA